MAASGVVALALLIACVAPAAPALRAAEGPQWLPEYWNGLATSAMNDILNRIPNTKVAKNLILIIGDGMGVTTSTAARILKGQMAGKLGEEEYLAWETFPNIALAKTYTTDSMTADSAGAATAFHFGFKSKLGIIGTDDRVIKGDCSTEGPASAFPYKNVLQLAELAGKSSGVVTTTRITHASPAPLFAKSAFRDWEADSDLPPNAKGRCKDIALQLIENGLDIEVVMGGGRSKFMPNSTSDPEYPSKKGNRQDGRNLVEEWREQQMLKNKTCSYVYDSAGFDSVNASVDCLLGLFEPSHMLYEEDRKLSRTEPSLSQMVEKAIQILSKNPRGFYLFIEGGRIDHGHHANTAGYALTETIELHKTVEKVQSMTNPEETLIVVSADHSHVFNVAGYARRGTPILGLMASVDPEAGDTGTDNKAYTVLVYGNGPGYLSPRQNLTGVNVTGSFAYVFQSAVPLASESHGGEDVPIYATGPWSHLFTGLQEQSYIPHVMAYAACLGTSKPQGCDSASTSTTRATTPGAAAANHISVASLLSLVFLSSSIIY